MHKDLTTEEARRITIRIQQPHNEGGDMKKSLVTVLIMLMCLSLLSISCKKDSSDDNPAGPDNPASSVYGSGSISFTAGALGTISMSGAWNGQSSGTSGSAVEALTGQSGNDYGAVIYGYAWSSSNKWNNIWLSVGNTGSAITTGTYTVGADQKELIFMFSLDGTSQTDMSNSYYFTSGTCNVTSYSTSGMQGTFSGTASNGTSTVNVTNGTFNVKFGTYQF